MITSTTGNTAVKLPPQSTAINADDKTQATTVTRCARAILSARLKLCMDRIKAADCRYRCWQRMNAVLERGFVADSLNSTKGGRC